MGPSEIDSPFCSVLNRDDRPGLGRLLGHTVTHTRPAATASLLHKHEPRPCLLRLHTAAGLGCSVCLFRFATVGLFLCVFHSRSISASFGLRFHSPQTPAPVLVVGQLNQNNVGWRGFCGGVWAWEGNSFSHRIFAKLEHGVEPIDPVSRVDMVAHVCSMFWRCGRNCTITYFFT